MTCAELRRDAAGLAALAARDPERVAAVAHARSCAGCAAALREGERLVALLDSLPPEPAPCAALRRGAAPVLEDLPRAPPRVVLPLAAAAAAALVVAATRTHSGAPRDWVAAGALALAAAAVAARAARGAAAAIAAVVGSILFAAWGDAAGPLSLADGLKCAATEIAAAAVPLVAALALWGRGGATPGRLAGAAAAGALAGQAALEIACHAPDAAAHLLVFHTGTVIAAAALGAAAGLRAARRPRPA
jgi:hypothetical protein